MQLALSQGFLKTLRKLDPNPQQAALDAIHKLQSGGPEQVDLHHLPPLPFLGFSVNRNAMRVVCSQHGETLLLLHIDAHDAAYDWARRHRVVRVKSTIQVIASSVEEAAGSGRSDEVASEGPPGPLAHRRPKDLTHVGFTPEAAAFLREVPSVDALLGLVEAMETPVGHALLELSEETTPLDKVVRAFEVARADALESGDTSPGPEASIEELLSDPRNRGRFWIPPPGEEGLARALEDDFEDWQVFLHASQRRLVEMHSNGPVKVTGGPGTGKTVVALHRARFLATERFPNGEIWLVAFSRALVSELERSFRRLPDADAVIERVRFLTAAELAASILSNANASAHRLPPEALAEAWAEVLERHGTDAPEHTIEFLREERLGVVVQEDAWTLPRYLKARRTGRGGRASPGVRKAIFPLIEAFEAAMDARGGADGPGLARRARRALRETPPPVQPAAVVVDELQDLDAQTLRLIADLVRDEDGAIGGDRLFMVGDGYQRIFERPVALERCGIPVRGRSRCLRLNYRTTEPIRAHAVRAILALQTVEDGDDPGSRHPYRSLRDGAEPELVRCESDADENQQILEHLDRLLRQGIPRVLVLAPTRTRLAGISDALDDAGRPFRRLETGSDPADTPTRTDQVVLCTFHRAKGLEAPAVIVAAQDATIRRPADLGPDRWARQQASLRYVATSRARDRLIEMTRA